LGSSFPETRGLSEGKISGIPKQRLRYCSIPVPDSMKHHRVMVGMVSYLDTVTYHSAKRIGMDLKAIYGVETCFPKLAPNIISVAFAKAK
jgi:hypothetical protein